MKTFKAGDTVWFFDSRDFRYGNMSCEKGKVVQVCAAGGKMCFVTRQADGKDIYNLIETQHVFHSRKEAFSYLYEMLPVQPGDLVSFIKRDYTHISPMGYPNNSLVVGTCIKVTEKYAHVLVDDSIKRVLREDCLVSVRP